jgi:hypothetical protein
MTLTDGSATFYLTQPPSEAPADPNDIGNLGDFVVNGRDHLYGNWWYYRAVDQPREYAFAGGSFASAGHTGTYTANAASVPGLSIQIDYTLNSSDPNNAQVLQIVTLTNNNMTSNIDLTVFNYVDYDLMNTLDDDGAFLAGPGSIEQYLGSVTARFDGIAADAWEIDAFPLQLDRFGDNNIDNLSNAALAGPGLLDYTAAFQWQNITLTENGGTYVIEEFLTIEVPEPAPLTLVLLGIVAAIRRR